MRSDAVQDSWATVPLSSVAEVVSGVTKGRKLSGSIANVPYLRVANVQAGHLDLSEVKDIPATDEEIRKYRLLPGDVLMTEGGDPDKLGRGCLWRGELPCCIHQNHIFRVRTNKGVLSPEFLAAYLGSPRAKTYFLRAAKQTTGIATINKTQLGEFPVPLLPLPEQHRIAAVLDKADAIQRKRKETIRLTEEFLRSAFLEMFGDPVTNPKGWPVHLLGDHLLFLTSGSRGWAEYYSDKGHLFLRIQNVGANRLLLDDVAYVNPPDSAEARRTLAQPGDVLLSITADLGRTAVVPSGLGPSHINQHLALLRVQGIEPLYLSAFLTSEGGRKQVQALNRQGVKAGLNFDDVRGLRVLVPPAPLQCRYSDLYAGHESLISRNKQSSKALGALAASLTHRAFRGEL
jgi:type I restriction enzyme, S subunit